MELIHFPFYLFEATVKTEKTEKKSSVAVDGVSGSFCFLRLTDVTFCEEGDLSIRFEIREDEARSIAGTEYKGEIMRYGLLGKRSAELKTIGNGERIGYPFWVCYFRKTDKYHFQVLDGISGRMEGMRMHPVFLQAFHQRAEEG